MSTVGRGVDSSAAARVAHSDPAELGALVDLASVNPQRAGALALARLEAGSAADDAELARLHWVIGRADRDGGSLERSRHHLEEALACAERAGDIEVLIGAHSSLAFTVARQGDVDTAEKLLAAAEVIADPLERARLMAQRGLIAYLRGELVRGADVLTAACEELRRNGDAANEARHRANLGTVLSDLGRYRAARRHLARAVRVAEAEGLDLVVAAATASLGCVSTLRGDLPGAIREFADAERRHVDGDTHAYLPRLHTDHARALADAGLLDDAAALLERARQMFSRQGQLAELPHCLLGVAEVRLAMDDPQAAGAAAVEAMRLFTEQRREGWALLAEDLALRARARSAGVSDELLTELDAVAERLGESGWLAEALHTQLVAARLRVAADGDQREVDPAVRKAVRCGRTTDRVLLASIDAAVAERRGDRGAARRAITHGLRVAMSAQAGLGAIETRAHAARYGYALSAAGARLAIADRRPGELLARIEATRLMSTRMPMLRPPEDEAMAAMLTELRSLAVRIADPAAPTAQRIDDQQQRVLLERRVLRHARGVRGDVADSAARSFGAVWEGELSDALAMLGSRQLVAYADVDGQLYAVTRQPPDARGRRIRLHQLGAVAGLRHRLDSLSFATNRLNRPNGSPGSRGAAAELLGHTAADLSDLLLPSTVRQGDGPVVVVPTARLHDVPWGLLPALHGRAVSVSPSVSAWAKAEQIRRDRHSIHAGDRAACLIAGPGLAHADAEVAALGGLYRDATVVDRDAATVVRCLELVAQADVVHFACHGTFRTDNPMFSSLRVADGPLVVYDFERLSRFPETVVLSACGAGTSRALRGGSLLGLAAALITLGVGSVIAPIGPVADAATGAAMTALHRAMTAGYSPAEALAAATAETASAGDQTTAGAFIALGA